MHLVNITRGIDTKNKSLQTKKTNFHWKNDKTVNVKKKREKKKPLAFM